ncbi:hypothetical protein MBLNU13_g05217t1 [Cladosporium sp. NU13]
MAEDSRASRPSNTHRSCHKCQQYHSSVETQSSIFLIQHQSSAFPCNTTQFLPIFTILHHEALAPPSASTFKVPTIDEPSQPEQSSASHPPECADPGKSENTSNLDELCATLFQHVSRKTNYVHWLRSSARFDNPVVKHFEVQIAPVDAGSDDALRLCAREKDSNAGAVCSPVYLEHNRQQNDFSGFWNRQAPGKPAPTAALERLVSRILMEELVATSI